MIIHTHMSCFSRHILHYPDPLALLFASFGSPSLLFWSSELLLPSSESFPYLSASENSPLLNQVSHLSSLWHNYFCCTITTTQHCIIYPNLLCAKPYKNIFVYLCLNNRVQTFIGIPSFPIKASFQKIYTSKVPEDWLNSIW